MKKFVYALVAVSAITLPPASAQTQGKSDWDKIVLEDKSGNVMTSVGGDYETAQIGKQLIVGEQMLLGDATKAKVVYYELDDKGNVLHKCVRDYTDPNTYIIDAVCTPAAAWANGGGINGASAGFAVGVAVIGAVLIGDTKVDPSPISGGSR